MDGKTTIPSVSTFITYNHSFKIIRILGVIVMNETRVKLGKRIKQLRKEKKWTQEQLADKADMKYKYLGLIERGKKNLTFDFIEKIAKGLDVELYQLFLFKKEFELKIKEELKEEEIDAIFEQCSEGTKIKLLPIIKAVLSLHEV